MLLGCFPCQRKFSDDLSQDRYEFDDQQLETLFLKCKNAGIKYIWFIPAELLNYKIFFVELKILLVSIFKRKIQSVCGYARSKAHLKGFGGSITDWSKSIKQKIDFFITSNRIITTMIEYENLGRLNQSFESFKKNSMKHFNRLVYSGKKC